MERWDTRNSWAATGDARRDLESLQSVLGGLIEIPDTGSADAQVVVRHGLGRVPRGLRIVNAVVPSPGYVCWYRIDPDDVWDEREIRLRFRAANARVLLEIF